MRFLFLLAVLPTLSAWTAGLPRHTVQSGSHACSAAAAPVALRHTAHAARATTTAMILLDREQETAVTVPSPRARVLDSFLERFQGHFDNHDQVVANEASGKTPRHGGGHEHIHCVLRQVPVTGPGPDGTYVLASYYANGKPEFVFRERLYAFDVLPDDAQFGCSARACVRAHAHV